MEKMIEVVSGGASASWAMKNLGPRVAAGDDAPGFFVDYMVKDLRVVAEAAGAGGLELDGLAVSKRLFEKAVGMGHGRDGTQAVRHAIEEG
ncbi:MAG: NAD-binding protein [Planctomycetota bacterium]